MIDYNIVATGSTGNCVILNKQVVIDVGVPYVKIKPYMDDIKLVLLTHVHKDHFMPSTLRRMALEKPLLRFACGAWLAKPLVDSGIAKSQIDIVREKVMYGYRICNIIPVELYHDVPNFGYKILFPEGKVFYATDTGNLAGIRAKDYDLYLVEANYEDEEIKARMDAKLASGQYPYEQRALRYHLSKKQCDNFVYANMKPTSEYVYLHCHVDKGSGYESTDN